jgi:hypothetical protein
VKRSGRRRASGGGAAEAEVERPEAKMERSGQRRARGGRGGTVGTTSGAERGRDCDVLWEEAWREAEAQREAEEWCEAEMQYRPAAERARQRRDVGGGRWVARGRGKWIFD